MHVKIRHILLLLIAAAVCVPVFSGCEPDENAYSEYRAMKDAQWLYLDSLEFVPEGTADSIVSGSLSVAVRHTPGYHYSNLWLEVSYPTEGCDSCAFRRDTLDLRLADDEGHWLGHGSGASFIREDTILRDFTLRTGSPIRLRHVMRLDTLTDIEQIGISFSPRVKGVKDIQ